ncbi:MULTISPECIES: LysE family translocator [Geobacillus]|jgi:threonine/homoserine/homoserine lactone efflux protein|uniref:LysE family translocator n=1 Tax=Geobacillus TaxID=129337 RepID=UPI0004058560|nr:MULTISPECIES: LysE family translocator [Geobacillus]ARA97553.1 homoserine transporter [Geobacillus thermodenitrificans]KQB94339.1 RhtB family transporter [Geobacillus sp. PA-3]PJW21586.1 LysE family translocator [Geobacillus thermodenitrificans]
MELSTISLFVVTAMALLIVPGPSVFYIMARSIGQGAKAGLVSVLGVMLGGAVHVVFGAVGISAILMTSAAAFTMVKYLGAVYLIYLGCKTLFFASNYDKGSTNKNVKDKTLVQVFYESVLIEVANPKTALFFLAFFPQFISSSAGSVAGQFLLLGAIFVVLALLNDSLYAMLAAGIRKRLDARKRSAKVMNQAAGCCYILLGLLSALASPSKP